MMRQIVKITLTVLLLLVAFGLMRVVEPTFAKTIQYEPNLTATPLPLGNPDGYEPNDSPQEVLARVPIISYINVNHFVGSQNAPLNFYPYPRTPPIPITATQENGDQDWFFFYAKRHTSLGGTGGTYRLVTTIPAPSGLFPGGVDTEMFLFRDISCSTPSGNLELVGSSVKLFGYNDDLANLNRASQIDFKADKDCVYWVRIWNKDPAPRGAEQTYALIFTEFLDKPYKAYLPVIFR